MSDLQVVGGEDCWRIDGFLRAIRVTPRIPLRGAHFAIRAEPNGGGTHIEFRGALTEEYLKWKDKTQSTLVVLIILGFLLGLAYIFSAVNFLNSGQGDPGSCAPLAIISLLGVAFGLAVIFEAGSLGVVVRLALLDPALRRTLEKAGSTVTLSHQETAPSSFGLEAGSFRFDMEPRVKLLLIVLTPVQLVLTCVMLRFWLGAVAVFLSSLFFVPLFLAWHCQNVARKLPFRYMFKARIVKLASEWYFMMSFPLLLLPSDLLVPGFGSLAYVCSSALVALSIALGLPGAADSIRRTFGGILRNPSLGYETVKPPSETLGDFNRAAIVMFSWISIVTYVGFAVVAGTLLWGTPAPLIVLLNFPLAASLEAWVRRSNRNLALRLRSLPSGGGETLDAIVRPGLYAEVQLMLSTKDVSFRVGQNFGFGAAISRAGLLRPRYLLLIDKLTFSIIMDRRQREALIWHEIAHHILPRREVQREARFGIWAEHVRFALFDSLLEEMRCDEFVIQRGLGIELLQALQAIRDSGVGLPRRPDEKLADAVKNYLRLASGASLPEEGHPHLEVRIKEVAERCAGQQVVAEGCGRV